MSRGLFGGLKRKKPGRGRRKFRTTGGLEYALLEDKALLASFSGTPGADVVIINFEGGRPATIEVNGETAINPDGTLELSLLRSDATSPFEDHLYLRGDDFNVTFSNQTGDVNGVVFFDWGGAFTLYTSDGNDVLTDGGMVQARTRVEMGAGNDIYHYHGGNISVGLGTGDDLLIQYARADFLNFPPGGGVRGPSVGAGEGFDVWESRLTDFGTSASLDSSGRIVGDSPLEDLSGREFERIIAVHPSQQSKDMDNSLLLFHVDALVTIQGAVATVVLSDADLQMEFVNFDVFGTYVQPDAPLRGLFRVLESSYSLTFQDPHKVVLGGDFLAGDTSDIQYPLIVNNADILVVSDSAATRQHQVFISSAVIESLQAGTDRILGLSPKPIFVFNTKHTILSASNTAADQFYVSEFDSHLVLYGNGGNDRFLIGHSQAGAARNLSMAGQVVNIVAGEGNDYLRADDTGSDVQRHFRVRDHWIHSAGSSPDTTFKGISFSGMERVVLNTNLLTDRVLVTPSAENSFEITGLAPGKTFEEVYSLLPPFNDQAFLVNSSDKVITWVFDERVYRFVMVRT